MDLYPTSTPVFKNPLPSKDATIQYMRDVTLVAMSQIAWHRELCPQTEFEEKVLFNKKFKIFQLSSDDSAVTYMMQNLTGAFDAVNRHYLKSLTMNIRNETGEFLLESYTVTYGYHNKGSPISVCASIGSSSSGVILTPVTQLRTETLDMLLRLENTFTLLEPLPETSLMDFVLGYNEQTPQDYMPTGFRRYTEEDKRKARLFEEKPLKIRQGRIESEFGIMGISAKFTQGLIPQPKETL